jgi:hypothetical protein
MNEIADVAFKYVIAPVISALTGFMFWLYKKQQMKIELLEQRVSVVEKNTAVTEVKIDAMKDDIKDIKNGVDKLIEKLYHKN